VTENPTNSAGWMENNFSLSDVIDEKIRDLFKRRTEGKSA
jgi:hypothetical protein